MDKNYGKIMSEPGTYILTSIPDAGYFEYLYKNNVMFLKVDQFGPSMVQINPPAGMTVIKRKERETFSPWKLYFKLGSKVTHNFDIYSAKKFKIIFAPNKATYELDFGVTKVTTTLFIGNDTQELFSDVKFESSKEKEIECLSVGNFSPVDGTMAIWDKQEWYETTDVMGKNHSLFVTKHYSVNGDKKDRKVILFLNDKVATSVQNSYERLLNRTKNFTVIPNSLGREEIKQASCYEQVSASTFKISSNESVKSIIRVTDDIEIDEESLEKTLNDKFFSEVIKNNLVSFNQMVERRKIKTPDVDFNNFVNYFIPLQLGWVADLDRGWATGMRGSRDCANDFLGYFAYNLEQCRHVVATLLNNQRYEDGWFPRQVPFGGSNKYDLRPFADSNAFVIELIYEYLCYSNDFALLDEIFTYYGKEKTGTGLEHLIKAATYYTLEENIGEHGLIKLHGGDWLDCLNRVGLKGRGETVMVTCQAILAFKQVSEVLKMFGDKYSNVTKEFSSKTKLFKENIKKYAYMPEEKYYKALFADDGNWYFSNKDLDGHKRLYMPTNAYAIISEVDPKNNKNVIKQANLLNESKYGYKLFTVPFGNPILEGMGKMGTGDFQPYMFENGAVYNHGGNLFYVRALAKAGDYKTLYRALNYALPYNPKFHPESVSCLPSYACTNAFNLIPAFYGRSGLCFLTGSIAMIERSVYSWMFGLDYHVDYLRIAPCLPKEYVDSEITESYGDIKYSVKYHGYGARVSKATLNGKEIELVDNQLIISKQLITNNLVIDVYLEK